jgi:plasmid stabilization system protein ParE
LNIQFHRLAERELLRAEASYRSQSIRTADRFVQTVEKAINDIVDNPLRCPQFWRGTRWLRLRKFPYLFYFK